MMLQQAKWSVLASLVLCSCPPLGPDDPDAEAPRRLASFISTMGDLTTGVGVRPAISFQANVLTGFGIEETVATWKAGIRLTRFPGNKEVPISVRFIEEEMGTLHLAGYLNVEIELLSDLENDWHMLSLDSKAAALFEGSLGMYQTSNGRHGIRFRPDSWPVVQQALYCPDGMGDVAFSEVVVVPEGVDSVYWQLGFDGRKCVSNRPPVGGKSTVVSYKCDAEFLPEAVDLVVEEGLKSKSNIPLRDERGAVSWRAKPKSTGTISGCVTWRPDIGPWE